MDYMSHTALSLAARENRVKCIEILLAAGANVNLQNRHGKTALHWGANRCQAKCANVLLQALADVNIVDRNCNSVMLELLMTRFHSRIKPKQATTKCFRLFLAAKANVNVSNNQGETILKQVKDGSLRNLELSVKLLLAAGETMVQTTDAVKGVLRSMTEAEPNLEHLCREAIRKHLLEMDPHENLFQRVPQLGLPSRLRDYLLYNQTLDYENSNDDDDDDDTKEDPRPTILEQMLSLDWDADI